VRLLRRLGDGLTRAVAASTSEPVPARFESTRRSGVICALSALVVLSLALSYVELDRSDVASLARLFDGQEYVSLATNVLTGNGYRITDGTTFVSDDPTAYRTPGYPLLLSVLGAVFGLQRMVTATLVIQAAVLAAFPVAFFFVSRRLGLGVASALGAAVVAFLFFPLRYLSMLVQPELVATMLLLLAIERLLAHLETGSMASAVSFALLAASAVLFKQNLAVVLFVFIFPLFRWLRRRVWMASAAVVVLMIGPWVIRNFVVVGGPVFSTNGGVNFYLGCDPELPVSLDGLAEHGMRIRTLMEGGRTELEADRELYRLGWQLARTQGAGSVARRVLAKAGITMRDYFPFIQNEFFYLALPIIVAWGRITPVVLLMVAQLAVGFLIHPVEADLRGLVYANLVDIMALKVVAGLALYYFARESRRGFQLILLLYFLVILPGLVFIPVDRVTYMADSLLIPAFAASPLMFRDLGKRLIGGLRKDRQTSGPERPIPHPKLRSGNRFRAE